MRQVTLLLFFIFSLNIFLELKEGECNEFASEVQVQTVTEVGQKSALTISHSDSREHSQDQSSHNCHFGHCAHIILFNPAVPSRLSIEEPNRPTIAEFPIWRDITPPLRPPIS